MSQSYFSPPRSDSFDAAEWKEGSAPATPVKEEFAREQEQREGWGEEAQRVYESTRDKLVSAISSTKSLLTDLQSFNASSWTVHYPSLPSSSSPAEGTSLPSTPPPSSSENHRRSLHRTLTGIPEDSPSRASPARRFTSVLTKEPEGEQESEEGRLVSPDEMHILRLDLKLGAGPSPGALVSSLEKTSVATLLGGRITSSIKHLDALNTRIQDTSSKVLVTGDLNAGKSTFVNALLRRTALPADQLPTTTLFCEVHAAEDHPRKIEEVHLVKGELAAYDATNAETFEMYKLDDLESLCEEHETNPKPPLLKVYLRDPRPASSSLLSNGTVNISLIDAPGLNLDTLSTTALFARQEEIDVIVFVLSAENRLTLSAKEFLLSASHEKACVFCVVNGWDRISERNRQRCRRGVFDQLRTISHGTWADRDELVHFVDSADALANPSDIGDFAVLESALRNFVLFNRQKSKLAPAARFLSHLLSDVDLLASSNIAVAESERDAARAELARVRPVLEGMRKGREGLEDGLERVEDGVVVSVERDSQRTLDSAVDRIGRGELALTPEELAALDESERHLSLPPYPGIFGLYPYAKAVKHALLQSLDLAVKLSELSAREATASGVKEVQDIGEKALPEGSQPVKRVFVKDAMFRRRSSGLNASVASGLGLGLAQRGDIADVGVFEIFDTTHLLIFSPSAWGVEKGEDDDESTGLGALSLAIGAVTMVGGKTVGARGLIEGAVRIGEFCAGERMRKWAAPIVGVLALGAATYFILELPRTIPRTIGRSLRAQLLLVPVPTPSPSAGLTLTAPSSSSALSAPGADGFSRVHAVRISREVRKVLRLASWDAKERFRAAMEAHAVEVRKAEEGETRAAKAVEWFGGVQVRTMDVRREGGLLEKEEPAHPSATPVMAP